MTTDTIETPQADSEPKRAKRVPDAGRLYRPKLNRIPVPYLPPATPENIKKLRLDAGWSLRLVARMLHLYDAQAASRYERPEQAGGSGHSMHSCAWDMMNLYGGTNPHFVLVNREVAEALGLPSRPKLDRILED